MVFVIITLLILLNGYFSLAEVALISVQDGALSDEKYKTDSRAIDALQLIRDPEGFLSAVQVGITLLSLIEGIYGGNIVAVKMENWFIHLGMAQGWAHTVSLIVGIGLITYLTIVIGELVPKSIALQMPLKISLFIAHYLHLFSKLLYPFIKLLTVSTKWILSFLSIKNTGNKKVSEDDVRRLLSAAYQQGTLNKQQLWLHENVFTFDDLTARRIMKPARIVASLSYDWHRQQVDDFISEKTYSYFPVYKKDPRDITGVLRTKNFYVNENIQWQQDLLTACHIPADAKAKDIFAKFKEKSVDFGIVVDKSQQYIGIVAMQDIMEGVFGDIPEIEDYADYFYKESDKVWIAENFIHLQRIRNELSLAWLREYESDYLSLGELVAGEGKGGKGQPPLMLNGIRFESINEEKDAAQKIRITLP